MPQFAHPWPRASCSARALKRSVFRVTVLERVMDFSFSSTPSEKSELVTTSSTSIQDMPGDDCGRLEYAP
ncbi:hypothetical protein CDAR_537261 [Caerostris darwini]|uniref:Uncharacterized protein n=1 Tax=Caerostris darwini TaxID=1538125 RepID=A0AAV4SU99_9ARAC|nr:hypothetical protein CDAR_537261 [Caerostris darwini]